MWLRLRQIAFVAKDLAKVTGDLRDVLGLEVGFRDPGVGRFGLENALFPVGNQLLEVVAPIEANTAGGRYLDRRGGNGGYMVITQCDDHAPRRKRVEALGIRLVASSDGDEYKIMQLHPKDTGGSFFEIDEQLGPNAHDVDGPWEPAGGEVWKSARRTSIVSAITAAEIQADNPETCAARWGEIAEIPVTNDSAGNPGIAFENAFLRFVPITDGRPEGLGGLDLKVVDRDRALAMASRRGCYRTENQVAICGVRLNLV